MKAAVLHNFNEALKVESIDVQEPQAGEVLVKVAASGICHSDLHVVRGDLPMPTPIILGHEGAGVVEKVGPGVTSVEVGDHVVLSWVSYCGKCFFCGKGDFHLCEASAQAAFAGGMQDGSSRFRMNGTSVHHFAGVSSFGEYTVVAEHAAIPIRKDAPLDAASLVGCGVMTGVGAVINTAKVEAGQSMVVFGCGGVGLNCIQGGALVGAEKVIAVDLLDSKLKMAEEFGATHLINASKGDAIDQVRALTPNNRGVDWAFEVIGSPAIVTQCFMTLRRGGKVVVVGVPKLTDQICVPGFSLPLEEKGLIGSTYGSAKMRTDMPRLIDLFMAGKLKINELISRRVGVGDINESFSRMEKGEVARSVIVYQ
jgi:S-(hydroxymethyl)glutathione dehydrogenase / alcohol dehydrogenase